MCVKPRFSAAGTKPGGTRGCLNLEVSVLKQWPKALHAEFGKVNPAPSALLLTDPAFMIGLLRFNCVFPFETVGIMSKKISVFILVLTSLVSTGCAALVVGAGAGAGAYSYANGELARTYQAAFPRTMEVCTQILTDLSMPIKAQHSEGEQTVIETERKDGTPVTLKVKIIGLDLTEVSVRTGVVGYWNRDLSKQFQEFIAQRLQP